jgi:hypothetical protein
MTKASKNQCKRKATVSEKTLFQINYVQAGREGKKERKRSSNFFSPLSRPPPPLFTHPSSILLSFFPEKKADMVIVYCFHN